MTVVAYHGTDRVDFGRFDIAEARIFNVGIHFGTRAAAESRIAYLHEVNLSADFRIFTCELTIRNPLRVEDVYRRVS